MITCSVNEVLPRHFNVSELTSRVQPRPDSNPDSNRSHSNPSHEKGNSNDQKTEAYPTDAKEKQKAKKKAGHVSKAKPKAVQDHCDDLGDDLSGLGGDLQFHLADVITEHFKDYDDDHNNTDGYGDNYVHDETFVDGLQTWWFHGMDGPKGLPKVADWVYLASNMETAMQYLASLGPGLDLCEFCGGEARTTTIAIRRHLRSGLNFDLVTHLDLGDPSTQQFAIQYLDNNYVFLLVMAHAVERLDQHQTSTR